MYMIYCVCIQGDAFGFMKLCAFIITELKNLSAASRAGNNPPVMTVQPIAMMPGPGPAVAAAVPPTPPVRS